MKKSALIKLVKEQISKTKLIKENKLAGDISSMVPDNTSYSEFAKAVATVLVDFYGKHNFDPFMKVLHSELGMGDSSQMNEEEGQDTYIVTYEIGTEGDDDIRVKASSEEEAIEMVKSGKVELPYGQKLSNLARNFHARKLVK